MSTISRFDAALSEDDLGSWDEPNMQHQCVLTINRYGARVAFEKKKT